MIEPKFVEVADCAVLVEFGTTISDPVTDSVQGFDRAIALTPPTGLCEVIPAFVNLLVIFDPMVSDHQRIVSALKQLNTNANHETLTAERVVEVCYDIDFAPDLAGVAETAGLDQQSVVNAHLNGQYTVGMYGFAPGYAYLSGTPESIQVPRKTAAVRDVPAGSLIVAGAQCLVTTLTMPTGWSILGRSPTQILDNSSTRPFLFDVGDRVRFERISRERYEAIQAERLNG